MEVNWYDAIIAAVLVICTWRGAAKGFAWQIATIGAIVICFVFAGQASVLLAPIIQVDPPLNRWIAMFILYIGASFVSFGAARLIRGTLKKWQFEEFDSHLGAVFGFVRGIAFALVITFFAVTLSDSLRGQVLNSYSGYSAGKILTTLHPVLPDEFHGVIDPYIEELGHTVVHDDTSAGAHDQSPIGDQGAGHPSQNSDHGSDFGTPPGTATPGAVSNPQPNDRDDFDGDFGPPPTLHRVPSAAPAPQHLATPAPTAITDIEQVIEGIPNDLKQSAMTAWRNTAEEDRQKLLNSLQSAIPGVIKTVSQRWASGEPTDENARLQRDRMLREIVAIYSADGQQQQRMIQQAERALVGVPEEVTDSVLSDWYADILGPSVPDPDPSTDMTTRFDKRILRQLRSHGVPLDYLRAELRTRLMGTTR